MFSQKAITMNKKNLTEPRSLVYARRRDVKFLQETRKRQDVRTDGLALAV